MAKTYKGFVMLPPKEDSFPKPDAGGITGKTPLLDKNQFWLEEIIKLCQDEGGESVFSWGRAVWRIWAK